MTYLGFHIIFNFPLLVMLSFLNFLVAPWLGGEVGALIAVIVVVMLLTSPWDSAAVRWGIWGFAPDRVAFRIGRLPIEEYLFFFLQSMNIMLAIRLFLVEWPEWKTGLVSSWQDASWVALAFLVMGWVLTGGWFWFFCPAKSFHYALHLGYWVLPILFFQWAIAPSLLTAHIGMIIGITLLFGTYYTLCDWVAIRQGIWFFDEEQITGDKIGGILPWEEVAFFYLTSGLVTQSFLLFLPPEAR